APLAASTLKNKRRGPGPSLIPLNMVSRFITLHRVYWNEEAGIWVLTAGWDGFVTKDGTPIAPFHMTGTRKMPRRDVGGVTPAGFQSIKRLFAALPKSIIEGGGPATRA